jgi:hypothetical protein
MRQNNTVQDSINASVAYQNYLTRLKYSQSAFLHNSYIRFYSRGIAWIVPCITSGCGRRNISIGNPLDSSESSFSPTSISEAGIHRSCCESSITYTLPLWSKAACPLVQIRSHGHCLEASNMSRIEVCRFYRTVHSVHRTHDRADRS